MGYKLFVAENSNYMDEGERHPYGEFESYEEAVAAARRMVDEDLHELHAAGLSPESLFDQYTHFGRDPFVVPDDGVQRFSAWDYARERSRRVCGHTPKPEAE